jgi:hypothetical protein
MIMVLAYRYNLKSVHIATDNHGAPVAITADIGEDRREVGPSQENQPMATKKKGVIATIIETISRAKGASVEEVVAVLIKAFPDRDADSMRGTVRIQCAKNCTSKDKDDKRGLVYYKRR